MKEDFYNYLLSNEYFFDRETIENYLISLKVKPFVILTGNSGTGKTKLSQLFAQYLNGYLENDSLNVDIDGYPDYIHAKVKASTIIKNSEATIKKEYLNKYLPINDYLGHFDGFIDEIPSEIGLNIVSYIRFKRSFIKEYIEPKYDEDDIIDIKIKLVDIIDFLQKPDFKGFYELQFKTGSLPKFRLRHMTTDQHVDFFNLDEKLRDCEVIIDGVSTVAKFYIYDSVNCLKSDEVDAYFEELSKKSEEHIITIKLNLDSFESFTNSNGDEIFEEFETEVDYSSNSNYKIIPVGANWTENRHIVGYYNVITNEYQSTPAYDLIKAANKSTEPHFLILDEMNLSHVERYFADFLSAIESGEKIPLYGEEELTLPQNLFIIGTVNVDETTYMFSPKVLDRANVIEFETYSASDYMSNKIDLKPPKGNIEFLENPLEGNYIRDYGIDELRDLFTEVSVEGETFWDLLTEEIFKFQEILKGSGFDFGFRVINEIVRFMAVAWEYEGKPKEFSKWTRYFDACIKQKLLPKLHGSEKIIGETLDELYKLCLDSVIDTEDMLKYPQSYNKLKEMREVLRKQRYVSFIN